MAIDDITDSNAAPEKKCAALTYLAQEMEDCAWSPRDSAAADQVAARARVRAAIHLADAERKRVVEDAIATGQIRKQSAPYPLWDKAQLLRDLAAKRKAMPVSGEEADTDG